MQPPLFIALFQGSEALVLLPFPPQIGQLLRQGWATDCSPRHGAGIDPEDLAGVLGPFKPRGKCITTACRAALATYKD
jgi:hypothetical protein